MQNVVRFITNRVDLRSIGRHYLDANPHDDSRSRIMHDLFGPLGPTGSHDHRWSLAKRCEREFVAGDVLVVDGWILSRSEARAAALTVLR